MDLHKKYIIVSPNQSKHNTFNYYWIILIVLIAVCVYIYFNYKMENMSNGVIDQLFAKDAQDTHLNGNIDNIASGRFNLFWNQPTLIANSNNNRGQLVPIPNNTNLNFVPNTNYEYSVVPNSNMVEGNSNPIYNDFMKINQLNNKTQPVSEYNKIANKYQIPDIASTGNGAGGRFLNENIVNPVAHGPEFVNLNGELFYPNSYVADPHFLPKPDIMYPLPVVGNVV